MAVWDMLDGKPASVVGRTAELALAGGSLLAEHTAASMFFHMAVVALATCDRIESALRWYDRGLDDARRRGSLTGFTLTSCFRSDAHYRAGHLLDAEADARAAVAARGLGEHSVLAPAASAHLVQVLIERGELGEAEACLAASGVDADARDALFHCGLRFQRGRSRSAQGRPQDGLADLLACGRWLDRWGSLNPSMWPWRSEAALALGALGRREEAQSSAAEEVVLAGSLGQPRTLGMALRAAGLVAGGDEGLELLREASDVLESSPARLEHARAMVDLGGAMRRRGRPRDARQPLREGLDLATRCDATALMRRARQELLAAGGRPRRPRITGAMALTPSERRVAEMAIEGRSNPEIAQALFVSLKTIETHLTRAYDKLDITRRSELVSAFSQQRDA
jgi:DNA-binding CsgD family transcriptional regulator